MSSSNGSIGRVIQVPDGINAYGEKPFKIRNFLAGHPLFEPERIKVLLRRIPRYLIEIRKVQTSATNDGTYKRGPMDKEADPIDTFANLDTKPAWMLLHETWIHDRDYGLLLKDYLKQLKGYFPEMQPRLRNIGCWMFLSSGKSVVHFHSDPDQSFLNQIKGSKTVFVYPMKMLPETAVENLIYTNDQGAVVYNPAYEAQMYEPVHIAPGDSVFLPLFAPHRVTNDDGVSISWNVGFHTNKSWRQRAVHLMNLHLRHKGQQPTPYGVRADEDNRKARMYPIYHLRNRIFKKMAPKVKL